MRVIWALDRDGNFVPYEVVSEDPVDCWHPKKGSYGYVALHVRRIAPDALEYPLTPDDPRLKLFGSPDGRRQEREPMGDD